MGDPADHRDHDVERLVDYVDGELGAAERPAVERQVADCADCARLVADLRALAVATRDSPAPATRPRDFRLTDADAVRLRTEAASEEPVAVQARLDLEMPNLPSVHADHDPILIAAASDGRLEPGERERAEAWLTTCADCNALHRDLVAIAAANRTLWTPARVRDYQLDEATAARLRRRDWRGFLRWVGSPRDALTRPLALGLTTLGIAGLLLTSGTALMPFASSGGAAALSTVGAPVDGVAAPEDATQSDRNVFTGQGEAIPSDAAGPAAQGPVDGGTGEAPVAAASAAASAAPLAMPSAMPAPQPSVAADSMSQLEFASPGTDAARAVSNDEASTGPPLAVLLSIALLIVGVALFVLRRVARADRA